MSRAALLTLCCIAGSLQVLAAAAATACVPTSATRTLPLRLTYAGSKTFPLMSTFCFNIAAAPAPAAADAPGNCPHTTTTLTLQLGLQCSREVITASAAGAALHSWAVSPGSSNATSHLTLQLSALEAKDSVLGSTVCLSTTDQCTTLDHLCGAGEHSSAVAAVHGGGGACAFSLGSGPSGGGEGGERQCCTAGSTAEPTWDLPLVFAQTLGVGPSGGAELRSVTVTMRADRLVPEARAQLVLVGGGEPGLEGAVAGRKLAAAGDASPRGLDNGGCWGVVVFTKFAGGLTPTDCDTLARLSSYLYLQGKNGVGGNITPIVNFRCDTSGGLPSATTIAVEALFGSAADNQLFLINFCDDGKARRVFSQFQTPYCACAGELSAYLRCVGSPPSPPSAAPLPPPSPSLPPAPMNEPPLPSLPAAPPPSPGQQTSCAVYVTFTKLLGVFAEGDCARAVQDMNNLFILPPPALVPTIPFSCVFVPPGQLSLPAAFGTDTDVNLFFYRLTNPDKDAYLYFQYDLTCGDAIDAFSPCSHRVHLVTGNPNIHTTLKDCEAFADQANTLFLADMFPLQPFNCTSYNTGAQKKPMIVTAHLFSQHDALKVDSRFNSTVTFVRTYDARRKSTASGSCFGSMSILVDCGFGAGTR